MENDKHANPVQTLDMSKDDRFRQHKAFKILRDTHVRMYIEL